MKRCVACGKGFRSLTTVTRHCSTKCARSGKTYIQTVRRGGLTILRFKS